MYGDVSIRLRSGKIVSGTLWDFITIPVPIPSDDKDKNYGHKVLVYGIVETDRGDFMARQLSEIKRPKAEGLLKQWENELSA